MGLVDAPDHWLFNSIIGGFGISFNPALYAWLMRELARNRPMLYRKEEKRVAVAFADEAGRDINAVARSLTPEDKLKALIDLETQQGKLCV